MKSQSWSHMCHKVWCFVWEKSHPFVVFCLNQFFKSLFHVFKKWWVEKEIFFSLINTIQSFDLCQLPPFCTLFLFFLIIRCVQFITYLASFLRFPKTKLCKCICCSWCHPIIVTNFTFQPSWGLRLVFTSRSIWHQSITC
jgi:hypothetical protein